jgi:hypothetical protein
MRLELKIAILRSGKTQRQVSTESRIPETRLSHIVRGRSVPTPEEIAAINAALGDGAMAGIGAHA